MSKGIVLTQSQIKAYENGAFMFMFPITKESKKVLDNVTFNFEVDLIDSMIDTFPIQKGDTDIYVKEEFFWIEQTKEYLFKDMFLNGKITLNETYDIKDFDWQPASKMTKEQSRFTFSECIDVRVVRLSQISKTGYFDGADINEKILKGLGLKWIGYFNRESYEEIGHKLFIDLYNKQMEELNIYSTYDDTDYVFLVEFKR